MKANKKKYTPNNKIYEAYKKSYTPIKKISPLENQTKEKDIKI